MRKYPKGILDVIADEGTTKYILNNGVTIIQDQDNYTIYDKNSLIDQKDSLSESLRFASRLRKVA